jgi:myo-inositol-1(or 4)-monophosphatase
MINFEALCKQTIDLTRSVGEIIQHERQQFNIKNVEVKGLHNYVTHVDKLAEEKLVEGLSKILPEAGFIAEEGTSEKKGEIFQWIIDPIDGTTNFIHGIPIYSISIGLIENEELVLGVVYEINANEMFYAWKDSPAFLNGQEIHVSQENDMHKSILATGFPYHDYEEVDAYLDLLAHFMKTTSGLRRLGSAAVDLVYVACGRCEGFYEYGLNPWDVAGGTFIVQQAGGKVSDWQGEDNAVFGKTILASNISLYNGYLKSIQEFF